MRTIIEQHPIQHRKGLSRNQLNLPIARIPITIQSSVPLPPTDIRSTLNEPPSPLPNTSPVNMKPVGSFPTNVTLAGSTEFSQQASKPVSPTKNTSAVQGEATEKRSNAMTSDPSYLKPRFGKHMGLQGTMTQPPIATPLCPTAMPVCGP
ncbi:hypothetical protein B0O80DRAFT_93271 [Mortierella sp. GBAus27b]|nr:hypothetical protein B0O80DRAFT_93271 [Mortierella sp. GBAus27b]